MPSSQEYRSVAVRTPLDDDVLLFHRMTGTEELGRPFAYELSLFAEDGEIDPDDVLGEGMSVRLEVADGGTRHFHGHVARFDQMGGHGRYVRYRASLRPWLWFLNQTADCRIFQEMSVPEIVMQVFRDYGFSDFEDRLDGTYEPWVYCVQYRETAFNFVSRLLEQEGIYYFFRHEEGMHTLVLADSYAAHEPAPGYAEIPYRAQGARSGAYHEAITDWRTAKRVLPGTYALNDFDFENPTTALQVRARAQGEQAAGDYEIYDYPGEFADAGRGEAYVRARMEGAHVGEKRFTGAGDVRGVASGALFELVDHPVDGQNAEYLVVAASFDLRSDEYESAGDSGEGVRFHCRFTAVEGQTPFRPAPITLKPLVRGPQTAFVVGPDGEEIWTDEYGRVKLQFHWDRYGAADENSSCWVRVAQTWAGKNWGAMHIPRIGHEVIVEFLEGDPDRPIVTGRVYNRNTMPPYPLPDNATISTVKSNSSKGGGGCNEIRFQDEKGAEQLLIHAEMNEDVRVKNDCFETIGRNRHLVVKQDQIEKVEQSRHETVSAGHYESIGGERHLKVAKLQAVEIGDSHSLQVSGDVHEKFGGSQATQVSGDVSIQATNICLKASSNITLKVGGSYIAIQADGIRIASDQAVELQAGTNGKFTAATGLGLKSDTQLVAEGAMKVEVKGKMTDLKGDLVVNINGAIVNIN